MRSADSRVRILEGEKERVESTFESLTLTINPSSASMITGSLRITDDIDYTTKLFIPERYPTRSPSLFVSPSEIPWERDRHVYEEAHGLACLCTRSDTRLLWPWGSNLVEFIERLVIPFFIGQYYFDTHDEWPPTGEREHGKPGIIAAFREILSELDQLDESKIKRFMELLARKNMAKGHEICPCGSKKRLRDCHREYYEILWCQFDPRDIQLDLKEAYPN